jgi:hypothetical protein
MLSRLYEKRDIDFAEEQEECQDNSSVILNGLARSLEPLSREQPEGSDRVCNRFNHRAFVLSRVIAQVHNGR